LSVFWSENKWQLYGKDLSELWGWDPLLCGPPWEIGRFLEEFGHFKFDYIEAATPQQCDSYSCGPMVIRNARLRMNVSSEATYCTFTALLHIE
jgi:hypothetical protein